MKNKVLAFLIVGFLFSSPLGAQEYHEVIVVGGGISGLTAAWYLKDRDVVVLEKENRTGGRTVSGKRGPFNFALGTEYLGPGDGAQKKLFQDLGLKLLEIPAPMDVTKARGKFWYGDQGVGRLLAENTSLAEYNRFALRVSELMEEYEDPPGLGLTPALKKLDGLTTRQWFDLEKFPPLFLERYNVAARGLFGANVDEVSALCFLPEIGFDFEKGEFPVKDMEDLENSQAEAKIGQTGAFSFARGIIEVPQAITNKLGTRVRLGHQVMDITHAPGDKYLVSAEVGGVKKTFLCKIVIMAVPAPVALKIGASVLSEEKKKIMGAIPYADYATVALFSDEAIWNGSFDLSFPEGMGVTDIYDSTWVERAYTPALASNKTFISTLYLAPDTYKSHKLSTMDDKDLLESGLRDMEKVLPNSRAKVKDYQIQRHPYAYPVFVPGTYERLARLHQLNRGSLLLASDYMVYPTFEGAFEAGLLAAEQALEEMD